MYIICIYICIYNAVSRVRCWTALLFIQEMRGDRSIINDCRLLIKYTDRQKQTYAYVAQIEKCTRTGRHTQRDRQTNAQTRRNKYQYTGNQKERHKGMTEI